MERSAIRGLASGDAAPDFAALHPGYILRARSCGGLDLARHQPADIAHGNGEIVLRLQVDPELRSVAEITAEAQCGLGRDRAFAVEDIDDTARWYTQRPCQCIGRKPPCLQLASQDTAGMDRSHGWSFSSP